jgi:hypothetical protein
VRLARRAELIRIEEVAVRKSAGTISVDGEV